MCSTFYHCLCFAGRQDHESNTNSPNAQNLTESTAASQQPVHVRSLFSGIDLNSEQDHTMGRPAHDTYNETGIHVMHLVQHVLAELTFSSFFSAGVSLHFKKDSVLRSI